MGDVADGMVDGTLCESCGTYLGQPVGYPKRCGPCQKPKDKIIERYKPSDGDGDYDEGGM